MGKAPAYGGVVVDERGRVLLRKAAGGFSGDAWTFPKGRPNKGETPEQTALRETREETGVEAESTGTSLGSYEGTVTLTEYFLMRPTGTSERPDSETSDVRWATPDEARELIEMSRNPKTVKRDLAVLDAALEALRND